MHNLVPIEMHSQRVLLTSQLAESYETTERRISENFIRNQDHYQEGKHFYCLDGEEKRAFINHTQIADSLKNAPKLYLWTQRGALLHAKSLNTDKAWAVYDQLVESYFTVHEKSKSFTATETLRLQSQAILELDDRMANVEDKLENQMTIDHGRQRTLQNLVSARVYKRIEENLHAGIEDNIQQCRPYYFQSLYKDLKNRFGVASYRDIKISQYDNAANYIQNWIEPAELRQKAG